METMLCENLKKVEDNVDAACKKAGRSRDEVTLIAVSKTKPVEMLSTIYNQGIRDFGENKVGACFLWPWLLGSDMSLSRRGWASNTYGRGQRCRKVHGVTAHGYSGYLRE